MNGASRNLNDKQAVYRALYDLAAADSKTVGARLGDIYHPDAGWRGSHPLNEMRGTDAIEDIVWQPLLRSFPDLERYWLNSIYCTFFAARRCAHPKMLNYVWRE